MTPAHLARRRQALGLGAAGLTAALILTGCAGGGTGSGPSGTGAALDIDFDNLATTTEPGTAPLDVVTWNLPYEPMSLDPMYTFNYAENTVVANLCEGLERITPELGIEPALAERVENPTPTSYVYTLREGVTFWDGSPVTPADVVYSLERQTGADSPTYWADYFMNVASVTETGEREVTVTLTQPDALFAQGMSSGAGAIVSKAAAEAAGEAFGTPSGGLMCSGAFTLDGWDPGKEIRTVANTEYWDTDLIPKVAALNYSFIADESTAINALRSGDVDGQFFYLPPAGLSQLASGETTTTFGKSFVFWTMRALQEEGLFAQPEVRAALLSALDRQAISDVVFQGAAEPLATLAGPDYFGDGPAAETFGTALGAFDTAADPAAAQAALAEIGDLSEPIVIAIQGSSAVHEQTANLVQAAGQSIGLTIETKVIPVEQFGNIYFDPKAREGIDGFFTTYYGNVPDPLDVYSVFTPGGTNNFTNYTRAGDALTEARRTLDPEARAALTVEAQRAITEDLPWMPLNSLPTILVQNQRLSGATASIAYLGYPWGATIGGVE